MRAKELAKQELISEKEGILKMGKNQAARKCQLRCPGKQHVMSELLPNLPCVPTQQSESPGNNSAIGLLSNMMHKGASSSSDIY